MDRVKIDLQHCYGIKALKHEFDFTGKPAWALYAPNGVMKSSFAETFFDASQGRKSEDRIFKDREAVRHITDETGTEIADERILVVRSYDSEYTPTEKTSTLLVSAELRRESEQLEARVAAAREALLRALRAQTGSKRDFAHEISVAMTRRAGQFEDAALGLSRVIERQEEAPFADVDYDVVFNEKVLKALEDADLMAAIKNFIARYNELLANSNYFRKGTFDYYNAGEIAKTLAKQGFFNADHTVNLYASGVPVEVKNQKQLMDIIEDEKRAILTEPELAKRFDAVQKKLVANEDLRGFQRYLQDNEAVLSKMDNIEAFRQDVLRSYLKANEELYSAYIRVIEEVDARRKEIIELARQQTTEWDKVLTIFNERFFVPFELSATNKLPVILGQVEKPILSFKYSDGRETVDISRDDLVKVLSMGERRALYLINVIFELRRRMKDSIETLVVVYDIAESFDYNNKYAIIQYLQDVSKDRKVKLIIMTHNFDFFRTIESRFVGYKNCLMATKDADHIELVQATYIRNAPHDWKKNFFKDRRKQIASIAFLRNIIEMTHGAGDPRFLKLTSMLHWKPETSALTVGDLDGIFNSVCEPKGDSPAPDQKIIDLIMEEADACMADGEGLKLENKIVLAIATRLKAESFVIAKINDDAWVATVTKNQTRVLIDRFRDDFPGEDAALRVLDRVELMTPENIHVNAFMYEPLIDMSDVQLRKLYEDVKGLA
ncbi:MAG: phage infection protein [Pseudomonadota bacterium]|nr:phage infection protein [Pseudomonadota bacterium]